MFEALQKRSSGSAWKLPQGFERAAASSVDLVQRLELRCKLEGHTGCVNTVTFSEAGDVLISGSDDRRVILWNWYTGRKLFSYRSGHHNNIFQARPLPRTNNSTIVTCAADGQVRVGYLRSDGADASTSLLAHHGSRAHKLALDPDTPSSFYSCGEDGRVFHYDLRCPNARQSLLVCNRALDHNSDRVERLELHSIHCNPLRPWQFVVGGSDIFVRVYDQRRSLSSASSQAGHLTSSSPAPLAEPVRKLAPKRLREAAKRVWRGERSCHATCANFSRQGEIVVTYNDENIYLFQSEGPWPASPSRASRRASSTSGLRKRSRQQSSEPRNGSRSSSADHNSQMLPGDMPSPHYQAADTPEQQTRPSRNRAGRRATSSTQQAIALPRSPFESAEGEGGRVQQGDVAVAPQPDSQTACVSSDSAMQGGANSSPIVRFADTAGQPPPPPPLEQVREGGQGSRIPESESRSLQMARHAAERTPENGGAAEMSLSVSERPSEPPEANLSQRVSGMSPDAESHEVEPIAGPIADLLGAPEEEGESSGSEGVGSQRSGESHDPEFLSHENMLSDSEEDDSDASEGSELEDESDESDSLILGFGGADNEMLGPTEGGQDFDMDDELQELDDEVLMSFSGHRNSRTVKGVSFLGEMDEYIMSGSDDGYVYIWTKADGVLRQWLPGDLHVVNCLEPNPAHPMSFATSGIEDDIKLWTPTAPEAKELPAAAARAMTNNSRSQGGNPSAAARRIMLRLHRMARAQEMAGQLDQEEPRVTAPLSEVPESAREALRAHSAFQREGREQDESDEWRDRAGCTIS